VCVGRVLCDLKRRKQGRNEISTGTFARAFLYEKMFSLFYDGRSKHCLHFHLFHMRSKYRRAHDVLLHPRYPDTALFVFLLEYISPAAVSVSGVAMAHSAC
jgi:hypothetical protein